MRKKLLSLALLALVACSAWAQNYTNGVAVGEGENFFLYNIQAGKFLTEGMDWGTHATLDNAGRIITLKSTGDGNYTIYSQNYGSSEKAGYAFPSDDTHIYMDGGEAHSWTFVPVAAEGYTNAYTIKSVAKGTTLFCTEAARVNIGSTADSWLIIPLSVRQTKGDYSYLLQNTDFNRPWERKNWSGTEAAVGGLESNRCGEFFNKTFDMYQVVNNAPKGRYQFSCQGFYRGDGNQNALIYLNSETSPVELITEEGQATQGNGFSTNNSGVWVPNSMGEASEVFTAGYYKDNAVEANVLDGTIRVGVKKSKQVDWDWSIFDNFKLTLLSDDEVLFQAVELPKDAVAAGKWYVVNVPLDGKYAIKSSENTTIYYTQNENVVETSEATAINATTSGVEVELVAGALYVNAEAAVSISLEALSYSYQVGSASSNPANGSYIQNGKIVVTFPNAVSTDPEATLVLDNTKTVSVNGSELSISAENGGFSFTIPNLAAATTYSVVVPASIYGFEGQAMNDEFNITFNTPAAFDGYCYLYNPDNKGYLSRGANWGTQALIDNYGIAAKVVTDSDGQTMVQLFDSKLNLYTVGFVFTDNANGLKFKMAKVEGGYTFERVDAANTFLAVFDGNVVSDAKAGANLVGTSNVWQFENVADHLAVLKKLDDAQAATAAAAAGIDAEDKASLETALADFMPMAIGITGGKGESYQENATNASDSKPLEIFKETVNGLTPGLYKLSVGAYQRATWLAEVAEAGGARGLVYVYANNAKTQIKSITEEYSVNAYTQGWSPDNEIDGKHYPNSLDAAYYAFGKGMYQNDVYVYVNADEGQETGSLTFGINRPDRLGNDGSRGAWTAFDKFQLTYYAPITPEVAEIVNGDFEDSYSVVSGTGVSSDRAIYQPNGWTVSYKGDKNDMTILNSGDLAANNFTKIASLENGGNNTYLYRGKWGNNTNIEVSQNVTLPAGKYSFACDAWKSGLGGNGTIFVGDQTASLATSAEAWKNLSLVFEVTEETTQPIKLGFNIIHNSDGSEKFIGFDNFRLYSVDGVALTPATMSVSATAQYGTFIAPFDVTIPEGVVAYSCDAIEESSLTLTEVETTIPANTPVVLYAENGYAANTFYGVNTATEDAYTVGYLTGVLAETKAPAGSYVLQNGGNGVKFYVVEEGKEPTVKANRCYLNLPEGSDVKAFGFSFGEVDAINSINADKKQMDGAIYNLNGQRLNSLQKGINIVNGKKLYVK